MGFSYDYKWNESSNSLMNDGSSDPFQSNWSSHSTPSTFSSNSAQSTWSSRSTPPAFSSFSSHSTASSPGSNPWASQAGWSSYCVQDKKALASTPYNSQIDIKTTDFIDISDDLISCIDEVIQSSGYQATSTALTDKQHELKKISISVNSPGNRGTLGQFQLQDGNGSKYNKKGRICTEKKVI